MKKNNKKTKRIRKLIMLMVFTSSFLVISTYAWFIGMKTVNVSNFDVSIATTEGLFLSMDGESWSYTLDAKGTNITETYPSNTNTWAPDGLIPVSSVGDMDTASSRLILYQKGSLTTTKGGYRLLTSRVPNSGRTESDGYVAFDLFIKNLSGSAYYTTNDPLNEEAIYLTTNSSVKVATTNGVAGTGIENSVRVAFAQVGRVTAAEGVASKENIQAISCADVPESTGQAQVTSICRNASIWEPNDKAHVANAINWYATSCLPRKTTGTDVSLAASYDTSGATCLALVDGYSKKTYAISNPLNVGSNVDVYDGADYNTYTDSVSSYKEYIEASDKSGFKLIEYPYFTDSMKNEKGNLRPTFMTLAPNSITKVRVYIYIEGQDVDNYDFASLGKQISINFGFTKERYIETDVNYTGPSTGTMPTEG